MDCIALRHTQTISHRRYQKMPVEPSEARWLTD